MKKNLFSIALITCASLSVLLSSCSMIKRHYTKGYYVSHSSDKTNNMAQKQNLKKKTESPSYTIQNIHESSMADNGAKQTLFTTGNNIIAANSNNAVYENTIAIPSKKQLAYSSMIMMNRAKENTKSFSAKKTTADSLAGDALSLFWIIIIILLVLWLIAILTGGWGLGWTVHLILLVALILLILWLLRII